MRISVAIVDDEAPARQVLREMLGRHPDITVAAECSNGFEAVRAVTDLRPDVLLLDVQMPKLDGFDVLQLIGREVLVIFITAHDRYAIRAFEVHAVDYLLKPFDDARLDAALDRARARLAAGDRSAVHALASSADRPGVPLQRILVRDRGDVHVIPVGKVDYVESQDDYVAIWAGGRSLLKEQPLGELASQLDARTFVRIHRRYLLNLSRMTKMEQAEPDGRVAVLVDGTRLPISRSGYARLRERLGLT